MPRKSRPSDHEVGRGIAPAAGASSSPTDPPAEGAPAADSPSRSVSHGAPIDPSAYRKLKEQAARGGRSRARTAQQDDSAPPCEDG